MGTKKSTKTPLALATGKFKAETSNIVSNGAGIPSHFGLNNTGKKGKK
jgi:hypothetical protein